MALTLPTVIAMAVLGIFAGGLGALVGIGGGVVIVPVLVLGFGIDIKLAVAASLVAVVATSTSAGSVYVGKGLANMRLGMTLEVATTLGGISGSMLAVLVKPGLLAAIFGVVMAITSALMLRGSEPQKAKPAAGHAPPVKEPEGREDTGKLAGAYYDGHHQALVHYEAVRLPIGASVSFVAGILSGMLGVGGGFIKVPAMTLGMRVPIKVAAATSNFMIGVTAISSLFVYFARGLVHPLIAVPVAIGVVAGSLVGTGLAKRFSPALLRKILSMVLILVAVQMVLKAFGVSLGK